MSLPRVAPATVQTAHLVGIGAGDENPGCVVRGTRCDGQDVALVLQQHHALDGTVEGQLGKLATAELRVVLESLRGVLIESQPFLHPQDATDGIVDAAHGNLSFLDQFLQQDAGIHAVRLHNHVDAGVDGDAEGVLLVAGYHLAGIEVVDVGPVGDDDTVPARLFLQPRGQQFTVGMHGHPVDGSRVDHYRGSPLAERGKERGEVLLTQLRGSDVGRCAVLTRPRGAVAHEVLQRDGNVLLINVLRVAALKTEHLLASHLSTQIAVLAEVLPDTGPAGVAAQVDGGTEGPRYADGPGFIGRRLSTLAGNVAVEGSRDVDVLRKQRTALRVGRAVVLVEAEDTGNADVLHRELLNVGNNLLPLLSSRRTGVRSIQDRTYLILTEQRVGLGTVDVEHALRVVGAEEVGDQLHHLTNLLLQRQVI